MIHMIVKWCCVEDKPADQSEYYRTVCDMYGEETADMETYELIIPPLEEPCTTSLSRLDKVSQDMGLVTPL